MIPSPAASCLTFMFGMMVALLLLLSFGEFFPTENANPPSTIDAVATNRAATNIAILNAVNATQTQQAMLDQTATAAAPSAVDAQAATNEAILNAIQATQTILAIFDQTATVATAP